MGYLPHDKHNPDDPDVTNKKKDRLLKALYHTKGIVVEACRLACIDRAYHYTWLKEDPDYAKRFEFITEGVLDFVETKLFERISGVIQTNEGEDDELPLNIDEEVLPDDFDIDSEEGKKWVEQRRKKLGMDKLRVYRKPPSENLIAFYLRTKGRKRGYTERTELTGAEGANLFAGKTEEELKAMIEQINKKME